jgi:hypothetical protein
MPSDDHAPVNDLSQLLNSRISAEALETVDQAHRDKYLHCLSRTSCGLSSRSTVEVATGIHQVISRWNPTNPLCRSFRQKTYGHHAPPCSARLSDRRCLAMWIRSFCSPTDSQYLTGVFGVNKRTFRLQ